tara:strand:+ start:3662 stop:5023 length:1362 start_codon:yes stop_codon:yes gene_type:complete
MSKKNNSVVAGKGYTGRASDYRMHEAKLYPNSLNDNDNYVDISNMIALTTIIEDIDTPFLEVTLNIVDATSLIETFTLNGGERIVIQLNRKAPSLTDTGEYDPNSDGVLEKWNLELYITEIRDLVRESNVKQYFTLVCTTIETYRNASRILDRAFKGSVADIIKTIITNDLSSTKSRIETDSVGTVSGIFPRIRPMQAIHWLSSSSFDNSTPFFFFATAKDGLTYRSYNSILNDEVHNSYEYSPYFKEQGDSGKSYFEQQKKIINISSPLNIGKAANIARGTYSSNVHVLDVSNKSYEQRQYSYSPEDMRKLNEFAPFNQPKDMPFDLNDQSGASSHFIAKNTGAYADADNISGPTGMPLLKAAAYKNNLEYMTQVININGDFNLSVGALVDLTVIRVGDAEYAKADEEVESNIMVDTLSSCKYMATRIVSTFDTEGFFQTVTVQSDSSAIKL